MRALQQCYARLYQERKAIIISTVRSSVGQLKHNLS